MNLEQMEKEIVSLRHETQMKSEYFVLKGFNTLLDNLIQIKDSTKRTILSSESKDEVEEYAPQLVPQSSSLSPQEVAPLEE